MTKLEAVNYLLRLIGTRKVSSETVQHPDVVDAVDMLDMWTKKCLERGWWFNELPEVTMQPDSSGKIRFNLNVVRFEYADRATQVQYPLLSKQNGRLVDNATQSEVFSAAVTLKHYITLPWENLPHAAQQYIMYSAGAEYVRDKIEDTNKENKMWQQSEGAYAELDAAEMRNQKYNMFDAPATAAVRAGRRPHQGTRRLR